MKRIGLFLLGCLFVLSLPACRLEKEIGNCGTSKVLKDQGDGRCCDDAGNCFTYEGKAIPKDADTDTDPGQDPNKQNQQGQKPEFKVCECPVTATDKDGDCMNDADEPNFVGLHSKGLDPNNPDTDGDGILDGCEDANSNGRVDFLDMNGNGVFDSGDVLLESDPLTADSDGDGIPDGLEDSNKNGVYDPLNNESKSTDPDTDRDGIPDGVEDRDHDGKVSYNDIDGDGHMDVNEDLNCNGILDPGEDVDGDGHLDVDERIESDPRKADTDGDGIPDGVEDANKNGLCDDYWVCSDGSTETTWDESSGGDGNSDANSDANSDNGQSQGKTCTRYREICAFNADMDGDCLMDGVELKYDALNNPDVRFDDPRNKPGIPANLRETDPFNPDTDGDCALCTDVPLNKCPYRDGLEDKNHNGRVDAGESDPLSIDSDGDGIPDTVEDLNCNGIVDAKESSPVLFDSDGDGLPDYLEDTNRNGICDTIDSNIYAETCAYLADTDGDGLNDGEEDFNLDGRRGVGETDPRITDTDGDNLNDGEEVTRYNTNPINPDTDGDGLLDGCEIYFTDNGSVSGPTNPNNPDSDGDGIYDGEEDINHNCKVDGQETDPRTKNEEPKDPTPVASGETCELTEECNVDSKTPRICSESPACPEGVERCCVSADWARWQICSTNNLKPLTYAQYVGHTTASGLPLGDDYSLAFEVEVPVGKDNQLPENRSEYLFSPYGDDNTGDGIFDPNNMNDTLLGHVFQSSANKLEENGVRLDRDIYGFIYILNDSNSQRGIDQIQNFFRNLIVKRPPTSTVDYVVDYQVLGSIDKAHDSSPQFPINKVSDHYEVSTFKPASTTEKLSLSPFDVRNDLIKRLLGGSLPAGVPKNDSVNHGERNFAFDAFQIRVEIVQRPNNIYLIVVSLTENDTGNTTDDATEARYLDRVVRLEDLSEGSALSRHDATVSKQCIMNNPAQARADLLFMVDDSGSMQQVINSARQAASDVRSVLGASRDFFDFRIAMTTSNRSATNKGEAYSGGGGHFYWEYSADKPVIKDNAGFFGFGTEKACTTETINISHDTVFNDGTNSACGDDVDSVNCERLIEACDNGLDIFSSQVCDMIYAMGGMCGVKGRDYSGVEEGVRSVLHFINRTAPAKAPTLKNGKKVWDKMHLRSWCDDPSDPACQANCDPRPKAQKVLPQVGCSIDEDCMVQNGERCLMSYGYNDGASDSDPHICTSVNGKCCYKVNYCQNNEQCGAGAVCKSGNGCESYRVTDSCASDAECNAATGGNGTRVCQAGADCPSGKCCYQTTCCFQDCEMVPLVTIFLSDEEDGYFKDDCRLWNYTSTGFDYEQLPSRCLHNPDSPTGDCTYEYCTALNYEMNSNNTRFLSDWPVDHDVSELDSSFWTKRPTGSIEAALFDKWLATYTEYCGAPGAYDDNVQAPRCRASHYHNYEDIVSDYTTYDSDCAACKRFLRRKEMLDFFNIYGRMYAITRNEGKAGETRECGTGSAEKNRGDGKAFRDLASNSGGKFSDVCIAEKGGSYKAFLQTIIADAQAASVPYPLSGVPIASTIKVGIYGSTRGEDGQWGMFYPPRSRVNGFNYDPTFNSLTFHTTPMDNNGNGKIDAEEEEAARASANLPKAGELVVISYRYWISVPCNDSCSSSERCVQEQCKNGEYLPTGHSCDENGGCRTGEVCKEGECTMLCENERVDYCVCDANCGNRCGPCETCEDDPLNPGCGVCVPMNNLCACNPDPMALTCDPNNPSCGPGMCCDESCVCVECKDAAPCKNIHFDMATGEVNTCIGLAECCDYLANDDIQGNECCPAEHEVGCTTTSEGQMHFLQCKAACDCGGACNPLLEFCSPVTCTCTAKGT